MLSDNLYKIMEAEHPCLSHEGEEIKLVCLANNCTQSRLFCNQCLPFHNNHQTIPFTQFQKRYEQLRQLAEKGTKAIKEQFTKAKDAFNLCINRAEIKVIKQFLPTFTFPVLPQLNHIENQQLHGLASQVVSNPRFLRLNVGLTNFQKECEQLSYNLERLQIYMQEFNSTFMASINKLMSSIYLSVESSQIKFSDIKKENSNIIDYKQSEFKFIQMYKPNFFTISKNQQSIMRNENQFKGLSFYAIVDRPLSKQNNKINFQIVKQEQRFIYFGVCDPTMFVKFQFNGPLYEKGKRMYAIRQPADQGKNSVCLHNSDDKFSNKGIVPWDFIVGDVISIEYNQAKNTIFFIKNNKLFFEVPLDKQIPQPYPFVGLKYQNDQVRILGNNQTQEQVKAQTIKQKKKSFFSFLSKN